MSTAIHQLQKMNAAGRWENVEPGQEQFYLDRIIERDREALSGGKQAHYGLRSGDFGLVNPGCEWYEQIRYEPEVVAPIVYSAPRFTCKSCGEHRDTTRRGHCDDCEA